MEERKSSPHTYVLSMSSLPLTCTQKLIAGGRNIQQTTFSTSAQDKRKDIHITHIERTCFYLCR